MSFKSEKEEKINDQLAEDVRVSQSDYCDPRDFKGARVPNYMWQKDTADGFRSFSTKEKGKVIRTGMTHPKVTRRTNFLFFKKKHTNGVTHKIKMHVDTVLSYRHMQIIL